MINPYAYRHIGALGGRLALRFRSHSRACLIGPGVPRWWAIQRRDLRHLSLSGRRLQSARMARLWCSACGVTPLPPMLPEPARPVPPSWRADR